MTTPTFLVPKPLGQLLGHLPALPGTLLLVTGLNAVLARQLPEDVGPQLTGKKLRLAVTDTQWVFDFEWQQGRFTPCRQTGAADLTISASAYDFVLLARRQEDPDTLFFNRRLAMEGDTELGLLVKNTIDAIEWPALSLDLLRPTHVLAQLRQRFAPR